MTQSQPARFEQFFKLGQQEAASPFLTPESRSWGVNLNLKSSILSAVLLLTSFILSWYPALVPISNLALVAVYFLSGIPSLIESVEDLMNLEVNIDTLMTLAAFSSVLIGSGIEGGLLLVLFSISHSMEDAVRSKAKSAISSLHKLSPTRATVVESDGTLVERSIKEITLNTHVLVKSGQVVPLDGTVIDGVSSVNLVHLTGENFPVTKEPGDEVAAGARNLEGALTLNVTRTSTDSTLARIIQLVTQAQEARPKLQRWFDSLSQTYATSIIFLAFFFAMTFPLVFGMPYFGMDGSVYRSLAFLIAASPCALIIAIPIAYLSAISVCAKSGIVLKGGVTLDALAKCTAFAFDKTGTLTTGDLTCIGIEGLEPVSEVDQKHALAIAYAMERNAIHPVAEAILKHSEGKDLQKIALKDFKAVPGYGLQGTIESQECYIGLPEYIIDKLEQAKAERLQEKVSQIRKEGELVAVLLVGETVYVFRFVDTPRPKIRRTIDALKKKWNLAIVMLTGDHEESARRIANELGINTYRSNLRPEDKLEYVSKLAEERGLAMVGDGINDAPALARATVGIGMGKVGTTAAIDASDIILLHDNVEIIDWLFGKAIQTQNIVRQNLIIATGAILFASLPALTGLVPLWLAVIMHEGGTVLVGLNALRLFRK